MYQNYKVTIYSKDGQILKETYLEGVLIQEEGHLMRFTAKKGQCLLVVSANQCTVLAEHVEKIGV